MTTMESTATTRFGTIEYLPQDVVCFPEGLLGFSETQRFVLIQHKEGSPFRWLQSLEDRNLAFLVVDPSTYVADFAPEMPDSVARELSLDEETPRLVYTIVTIPRGRPQDMTLNLAGPILINAASGQAKQVVLDSDTYPIRYRVVPEVKSEAA